MIRLRRISTTGIARMVNLFNSSLKNMADLSFVIFCIYCFTCTLGALVRLSYGKSSLGVTSIFMALMIASRFRHALRSVSENMPLALWVALIAYVVGSALISGIPLSLESPTYWKVGALSVYVLFAGAVASITWSVEKVITVAKFLLAGLLVCVVLNLIDIIGLIDIPRINDAPLDAAQSFYPYGQFGHRTLMALYLAPMLTFLFTIQEARPSTYGFRIGVIVVGAVFMFVMIWSRNRSGPAAFVMAIGIVILATRVVQGRMPWRMIGDVSASITLAWALLIFYAPKIVGIYIGWWASSLLFRSIGLPLWMLQRFIDMVPAVEIQESDFLRWELFLDTITSVSLHPFGDGFVKDPHIWFGLDIIHASGVVGVLWLALVGSVCVSSMLVSIKDSHDGRTALALVSGLAAWFFVGIMYNALYTGLIWGFFAIALAFSNMAKPGACTSRPTGLGFKRCLVSFVRES